MLTDKDYKLARKLVEELITQSKQVHRQDESMQLIEDTANLFKNDLIPELTYNDIRALSQFKAKYPTWWWKLGWCDVSRDFDCAPQGHSPEFHLIGADPREDPFNCGFSCDSRGSFADAIHAVMEEIENEKTKRNAAPS